MRKQGVRVRQAAGRNPPILLRLLVRLESWIVPAESRRAWLAKRQAELCAWWTLVERGEMPSESRALIASHCSRIFPPALWMRFSREHLRWWLRGPAFPLAAAAAFILILAVFTKGLAYTRYLAGLAISSWFGTPAETGNQWPEAVTGHLFPLAFALLISAALLVWEYRTPCRTNLVYWCYLASKTMATLAALVLAWIEAGAVIRTHLPDRSDEAATAMVVLTLLFIFLFGRAVIWSLEDQRLRCPVCLHLLALPIRIGSVGSMLEPATTEMVCERGHGRLVTTECGSSISESWVDLDESWKELFETEVR